MSGQPMTIDISRNEHAPMLVNGVRSEAVLEIMLGVGIDPTVTLDGVEVKAKVYREGWIFVDTTVPPLLRREVTP